MGTATTLTVINEKRELVGGMILPGLGLSLEALSAKAAQLPPVTLTPPKALMGTDTLSCMNNGALYGAAGAIEGITARLEEECGPLTVVLTGGMAPHVLPLLRRKVAYEPHLQLLGLQGPVAETQKTLTKNAGSPGPASSWRAGASLFAMAGGMPAARLTGTAPCRDRAGPGSASTKNTLTFCPWLWTNCG